MSYSPLQRLFHELKRRKVFRIAGVYAVVAWGLIEISETVAPLMAMPAWAPKIVLFLALFGFPIALVIAWAFEVTPEGVKRTESDATESAPAGSHIPIFVAVVTLLALAGLGAYAYLDRPISAEPDGPITSMAVLPFVDLSAENNQEYFSDGITEELLDALAQVDGLRVPARTSSFAFKGKDADIREIARKLNVEAVLEGSVRKDGNQLRITAQLIEAEGGYHLWSEIYERRLTDIFAVQEEISRAIVEALRVHLTDEDRGRLAVHGTQSTIAYDLYLRGSEYLHKPGLSTRERRSHASSAITLLREALREDPEYAPGWAALARAYGMLPDLPAEENHDSTVAFARKSIALDPELADGYVELGRAHWYAGEIAAAQDQFEHARTLNPEHAEAIAWISNLHWAAGRYDEAIRDLRRALELDPANWEHAYWLGLTYAELGLFDRAREWTRIAFFEISDQAAAGHCELANLAAQYSGDLKAVRLHTDSALALLPDDPASANQVWHCAYAGEAALGNYEAAKEHIERYAETVPENEFDRRIFVFIRGFLALKTGESERADAFLKEAERLSREQMLEMPDDWDPRLTLFEIQAARGELDAAVESLRQAVERGYSNYYWLQQNPETRNLLGYPPFDEVLTELKSDVDRMRERVLRESW